MLSRILSSFPNLSPTSSGFRLAQDKSPNSAQFSLFGLRSTFCLILGFFAICIAAWLSEKIGTGSDGGLPRSERTQTNQVISTTTRRIDLYSASAEDKETDVCFFDFHEIGDPPRLMKNPLTDFRVLGQDPQSESQKASRCKAESELMKSPRPGSLRRYLRQ